MKIVQYGDPILRKVADLVEPDKIHELQSLIDEMFALMQVSEGVGLAAPQIGVSKRLFIAGEVAYINPVIVSCSKTTQKGPEGCLSIPGVSVEVDRAVSVAACYFNRLGQFLFCVLSGFDARVFQHELDHLDGVLITDYLES